MNVQSKKESMAGYMILAFFKNLCGFSVDFPMVKWSDDSPWLIEDLKKLEVVEEYE